MLPEIAHRSPRHHPALLALALTCASSACYGRQHVPLVEDDGSRPEDTGMGDHTGPEPEPEPAVVELLRGTNIAHMASTDTHLFWVEYGRFDAMNNYEGGGTLNMTSYDDRTTRQVVSDIVHPTALAITNQHAYVVERRYQSNKYKTVLRRIDIESGESVSFMRSQEVDESYYPSIYITTGHGERVVWVEDNKIYSMRDDNEEIVMLASTSGVGLNIHPSYQDDSHLYFSFRSHSEAHTAYVRRVNFETLEEDLRYSVQGLHSCFVLENSILYSRIRVDGTHIEEAYLGGDIPPRLHVVLWASSYMYRYRGRLALTGHSYDMSVVHVYEGPMDEPSDVVQVAVVPSSYWDSGVNIPIPTMAPTVISPIGILITNRRVISVIPL